MPCGVRRGWDHRLFRKKGRSLNSKKLALPCPAVPGCLGKGVCLCHAVYAGGGTTGYLEKNGMDHRLFGKKGGGWTTGYLEREAAGSERSASASTWIGCRALRPVVCSVWSRQEVPMAQMIVSSAAARTAGANASSAIWIESA